MPWVPPVALDPPRAWLSVNVLCAKDERRLVGIIDTTAGAWAYAVEAVCAAVPTAAVPADTPVAGERAIRDGEGSLKVIDTSATAEADKRIASRDNAAIAGDGLVTDEATGGDGGGSTTTVHDGAAGGSAATGAASGQVADERAVDDSSGRCIIVDGAAVAAAVGAAAARAADDLVVREQAVRDGKVCSR